MRTAIKSRRRSVRRRGIYGITPLKCDCAEGVPSCETGYACTADLHFEYNVNCAAGRTFVEFNADGETFYLKSTSGYTSWTLLCSPDGGTAASITSSDVDDPDNAGNTYQRIDSLSYTTSGGVSVTWTRQSGFPYSYCVTRSDEGTSCTAPDIGSFASARIWADASPPTFTATGTGVSSGDSPCCDFANLSSASLTYDHGGVVQCTYRFGGTFRYTTGGDCAANFDLMFQHIPITVLNGGGTGATACIDNLVQFFVTIPNPDCNMRALFGCCDLSGGALTTVSGTVEYECLTTSGNSCTCSSATFTFSG